MKDLANRTIWHLLVVQPKNDTEPKVMCLRRPPEPESNIAAQNTAQLGYRMQHKSARSSRRLETKGGEEEEEKKMKGR
jgi:hypothetical protein